MNIAFHLNGKAVELDILPHRRTVHVLTEDFQCRSLVHCRYDADYCSCLILMNDVPVHPCILPAFELRRSEVWTMEGLANTKGYNDILDGFSDAGVRLCPLCAPSRALAAEALLRRTLRPLPEELREAAESVHCSCGSTRRILDAMLRSARNRESRLRDS